MHECIYIYVYMYMSKFLNRSYRLIWHKTKRPRQSTIYLCVYQQIHVCMYIYIYFYRCIYIYYRCVYIYIYIYIYKYICISAAFSLLNMFD